MCPNTKGKYGRISSPLNRKSKDSDSMSRHMYTYFLDSHNTPWPSCSKLTTSLVNDSLKFTSSDMQIC